MKHLSLLCIFALLFVVVLSAAVFTAAQDESPASDTNSKQKKAIDAGEVANPNNKDKPIKIKKPSRRSLFAACRSEILANDCMSAAKKKEDGTGAGRRYALRATLECLETNADKIKESSCKSWLTARKRCQEDTTSNDVCPKDAAAGSDDKQNPFLDDTTKCLLNADIKKLSKDCRESEYFRSLTFQRFWRARRDKNIRMNNKDNNNGAPAASN